MVVLQALVTFLLVVLKSHGHTRKSRTLTDLKDAIKREGTTIDQDCALLVRVNNDFRLRIEKCIQ